MSAAFAYARTPWKCSKPDAEGCVRITDKNGLEILVCETTIGAHLVHCVNIAPEMLESLQSLVGWYASRSGGPSGMSRVSRAERVIAKAEQP